mgnify:CR=1 FL=1
MLSCLVAACFLLMFILIGLSVKTVATDKTGVHYRETPNSFHGDELGPGRYVLYPDSTLIKYSNLFVPKNLRVECFTQDGLSTVLMVNIQVRYMPGSLRTITILYEDEKTFNDHYLDSVMVEIMRGVCSEFTSFQFYESRGAVQTAMINAIDAVLPKIAYTQSGQTLQLTNIDLSEAFIGAIRARRAAEQDIAIALNKRAQALTIASTSLSNAEAQGVIAVNQARSEADGIRFAASEGAAGIEAQYRERLNAYQIAMQQLGMNASEYCLSILRPRLIERLKDGAVRV